LGFTISGKGCAVAEPTNRYQTEYAAYAAARAAGESSGRAAEPTAADRERVETIIMAWPSGVGLADIIAQALADERARAVEVVRAFLHPDTCFAGGDEGETP
jgi:hypothetical protein